MIEIQDLINTVRNLSDKERKMVIDELLSHAIDFIKLKTVQVDDNGIACPHCESTRIIRYGKLNKNQNINRFYCKNCRATFTPFTGTSIHWVHKKKLWQRYIELMLDGTSIRKSAELLGISTVTSFNWRHKILSALSNSIHFQGIVESDETYFRESQKGSRKLKRPARKRGLGDNQTTRGISIDKVAVVVSADRSGNVDMVKAAMGRIKISHLVDAFRGKLSSDNILCSDSHHTYKGYAKWRKVEHKMVNASKKQYVNQKIYHIQHVNSIHRDLKYWIDEHFYGVATKYLHNYLCWMMLLGKIKTSSNKAELFFGEVLMSNKSRKVYSNIELEYLKFVA